MSAQKFVILWSCKLLMVRMMLLQSALFHPIQSWRWRCRCTFARPSKPTDSESTVSINQLIVFQRSVFTPFAFPKNSHKLAEICNNKKIGVQAKGLNYKSRWNYDALPGIGSAAQSPEASFKVATMSGTTATTILASTQFAYILKYICIYIQLQDKAIPTPAAPAPPPSPKSPLCYGVNSCYSVDSC